MQNLYFVLTIVNRAEEKEFTLFFERYDINNIYSSPAVGTASDSVLDLLGISRTEKTVHLSLLPERKMRTVLRKLTTEMLIDLPGRGIAVAIPLSSIGGRDALRYFSHGEEQENEPRQAREAESETTMAKNTELIVVICEKGQNDLVMDAARGAGARGGTVVRAKGTGSQYTDKFFGLSIAEEKELIYIVSSSEKKAAIMTAIMKEAGAGTEARAVVFALPVSETAGLRLIDEENEG